jgi:hypothetical protein
VQNEALRSADDGRGEAQKTLQNKWKTRGSRGKGETPRVGLEPTAPDSQATAEQELTEPGPSAETKYDTKKSRETAHDDPDLRAVVDAWPALPDAVRAGIVAMVRASSMGTS